MSEATDSTTVLNFDPNMVTCGRMTKQVVRITLAQWEYRKAFDMEVSGNMMGMSMIDCAIGNLWEQLCGDREYAMVELESEDGILETYDDTGQDSEDWVRDMIISAEIVSIEPKAETPQ